MTEPECILFDEPLSALDALLREEMRSELKALVSQRGITSVFVTHDQTEAMSMSDMIAVMSKGRIEQYASPEDVYSTPATRFTARFVGSSDWIDEETMFRPENASLERISSDDESYMATVTGSEFLGSSYRILMRRGKEKWVIDSEKRIETGKEIPIYINRNSILRIDN